MIACVSGVTDPSYNFVAFVSSCVAMW